MKSTIISSLLDYLLPSYCLECGERLPLGKRFICSSCFEHIPLYRGVENYYRPWERLEGLVPFTEYSADLLFTPNNTARALIHQVKYHGHPELGTKLAAHFAPQHLQLGHFEDCSVIVPVPLSRRRMHQRGYNQAKAIADGMSRVYQLPVEERLLVRDDGGVGSQTRRDKQSRWDVLDGVFKVPAHAEVSGRRILVVDDVLTTGATLVHAGRALLDAGAESVSFYTLAVDVLP